MESWKLGLTTISDRLGRKRYSTKLSKHNWKLSNEKIQYEIKWNIAAYVAVQVWF